MRDDSIRAIGAGVGRFASPGYALIVLACGHAVWALVAYREPLQGLIREGVVDSVGDGLFRAVDAEGARAAGFWFLFAAPLMALCGYLVEVALRAGGRALTVSGRTVLGLGIVGTAVMPRSGFPAVLPIGYWLVRRGGS